ncbi:MAG TPA: NAD(P)-dependent oxidoreductase [Usitatibacter sp.]|nr:NAD(P)-dependent oxidoreductase [Usitatibacter sp.]
MRVFVAGATGALGRALVPQLLEAGHEVVGLARDASRGALLERWGARAAVANPFDREALIAAVRHAGAEVVLHQLTALAGNIEFRNLDGHFERTNRMRTEVTQSLLAAARLVRARLFVAQSYCGWPYAREGGPVKTEEDPLDRDPPAAFGRTLAAIRYLEEAVQSSHDLPAIALRYGSFYGPGTSIAREGSVVALLRAQRLPIVGDGAGIWSFIQVEDAARATLAAIARGTPGIYNVVDDEPAPVSEWLPALAASVGAEPPSHMPAWLGWILMGEGGVSMMTRIRGGSNAKAKRELGWRPAYASWRKGFVEGL